MSPLARLIPLDAAAHREVQALLPWHATHTLASDETLRVEAHLAACPRCRADLQWERNLVAAQRGIGAAGDVERGFDALRLQIETQQPRRRALPSPLQRLLQGWRSAAPWLRRSLALQCIAVLALAATLVLLPLSSDDYRTLGTGPPPSANLVVKFHPGTPEREIARTLAESGARFVGGPTASQAYLLAVAPERLAAALARLRAQPSIALAESLAAAEPAP